MRERKLLLCTANLLSTHKSHQSNTKGAYSLGVCGGYIFSENTGQGQHSSLLFIFVKNEPYEESMSLYCISTDAKPK